MNSLTQSVRVLASHTNKELQNMKQVSRFFSWAEVFICFVFGVKYSAIFIFQQKK